MYLMNDGIWFMLIFGFEALYDYPRYYYVANMVMAIAVFPIIWRLEPMADVYIGMNLRGVKNRNLLNQ